MQILIDYFPNGRKNTRLIAAFGSSALASFFTPLKGQMWLTVLLKAQTNVLWRYFGFSNFPTRFHEKQGEVLQLLHVYFDLMSFVSVDFGILIN